MNRQSIMMLLVLIALIAAPIAHAVEGDAPGKLRVGVYDSRAVGLAYGQCGEFKAKIDKMKADYAAAEAAGDSALVKELGERGPWLQERMHMQVFSNLPIGDILEGREEMIARVAESTGVDIIVPSVAWMGEGVEIVDVTKAFAMAFGIDEEAAKEMVREVKNAEPVQLPFDFGD